MLRLGDYKWILHFTKDLSATAAVPNLFGTRNQFHRRQFFHWPGAEEGGWFGDNSNILHLLFTLSLLLLHCDVQWNNYTIHHNADSDRRLSSNVSDGEGLKIQMKLQLLAWALTSCWVAWLLTSHPPVAVHGLGAMRTPVLWYSYKWMLLLALKISIQLTKVQACKTAQIHMSHKQDLARPCIPLLVNKGVRITRSAQKASRVPGSSEKSQSLDPLPTLICARIQWWWAPSICGQLPPSSCASQLCCL